MGELAVYGSGLLIFLIVVVVLVVFSFVPIRLWISALAAGAQGGIVVLIGMRLRRVSPAPIVNPCIKADTAGRVVKVLRLNAT